MQMRHAPISGCCPMCMCCGDAVCGFVDVDLRARTTSCRTTRVYEWRTMPWHGHWLYVYHTCWYIRMYIRHHAMISDESMQRSLQQIEHDEPRRGNPLTHARVCRGSSSFPKAFRLRTQVNRRRLPLHCRPALQCKLNAPTLTFAADERRASQLREIWGRRVQHSDDSSDVTMCMDSVTGQVTRYTSVRSFPLQRDGHQTSMCSLPNTSATCRNHLKLLTGSHWPGCPATAQYNLVNPNKKSKTSSDITTYPCAQGQTCAKPEQVQASPVGAQAEQP